jgi:hypothetical protein
MGARQHASGSAEYPRSGTHHQVRPRTSRADHLPQRLLQATSRNIGRRSTGDLRLPNNGAPDVILENKGMLLVALYNYKNKVSTTENGLSTCWEVVNCYDKVRINLSRIEVIVIKCNNLENKLLIEF